MILGSCELSGAVPVTASRTSVNGGWYAALLVAPRDEFGEYGQRLGHSRALVDRIVRIETTDKLTDPQIVARVKEHYGIGVTAARE